MSLFYNNYQKLQKENRIESSTLSDENWETLGKMQKYISAFDVSLFETEIIKKDLIGTAKEAEIEKMTFREKIGIPEKEFCDSLVSDVMRHGRTGWIVLQVRNMALWIFAVCGISFITEGRPESMAITLRDLILILILAGAMEFMQRYVTRSTVYNKGGKRFALQGLAVLAWVGVWALYYSQGIEGSVVIYRGNGWLMFGLAFIFAAIAFFGNNYYWDKCSEKYNWK